MMKIKTKTKPKKKTKNKKQKTLKKKTKKANTSEGYAMSVEKDNISIQKKENCGISV